MNVQIAYKTLWASFTNSLPQHKPSFGIKIVLLGFTKDEFALKRRGQLFLRLTLLNMHL